MVSGNEFIICILVLPWIFVMIIRTTEKLILNFRISNNFILILGNIKILPNCIMESIFIFIKFARILLPRIINKIRFFIKLEKIDCNPDLFLNDSKKV